MWKFCIVVSLGRFFHLCSHCGIRVMKRATSDDNRQCSSYPCSPTLLLTVNHGHANSGLSGTAEGTCLSPLGHQPSCGPAAHCLSCFIPQYPTSSLSISTHPIIPKAICSSHLVLFQTFSYSHWLCLLPKTFLDEMPDLVAPFSQICRRAW